MKLKRITIEPNKMGGRPCIRGLRIPVATVIAMLADGMSESEILEDFPDLEPEDIRESLRYVQNMLEEHQPSARKSA
jgi:uncharacterized protein (DUF433 family)